MVGLAALYRRVRPGAVRQRRPGAIGVRDGRQWCGPGQPVAGQGLPGQARSSDQAACPEGNSGGQQADRRQTHPHDRVRGVRRGHGADGEHPRLPDRREDRHRRKVRRALPRLLRVHRVVHWLRPRGQTRGGRRLHAAEPGEPAHRRPRLRACFHPGHVVRPQDTQGPADREQGVTGSSHMVSTGSLTAVLTLRPHTVVPRPLDGAAAVVGLRTPPASWARVHLTGITHDSREVRPGDLYAALPGASDHGARFTDAAAEAGAVAILTDADGQVPAARSGLPILVVPRPRAVLGKLAAWVYGEPARDLLLIGITGTNGKTTTAHLAEAGLRAAGHKTGLVGTVETRIGDAATASVRTTPESTDLHALFAVMRERGVTAAVMEVSSHALAFGRVDGVLYDVAAFTNLSQDHLDFHRDMEDYFTAKRSLFTPQRARRGVLNIDDDYGRRLAAESEIPVVTISATGRREADWMGTDTVLGAAESALTAIGPGGVSVRIHVGMPGRYNLENALLAVVALATAGIPVEEAAAGVGACPGVPGRMERIDTGQPFLAVVDYAHTPDAIATVLATLREVTKGRLVAVVGCGGDRDRAKRPLMGEVAARGADVLVITDDNPRSEDPAAIRAAALAGATSVPGPERAELAEVGDRRAAIASAVRLAGPHDTVVILGKGHEQGQEIGSVVMPFDDRAVLRAALTEMMSADPRAKARPRSTAAGGRGPGDPTPGSRPEGVPRQEAP